MQGTSHRTQKLGQGLVGIEAREGLSGHNVPESTGVLGERERDVVALAELRHVWFLGELGGDQIVCDGDAGIVVCGYWLRGC